jgi:CMP-N-acetylneuraminic acid synthetase
VEASTDSIEIARCCELGGLPVSRIRPSELATDEASSVDVVLDLLKWKAAQGERYDAVALLQPTTPMRKRAHWDQALHLLRDAGHDAVVGVGPAQSHPCLTFRMAADARLTPWISDRPASLRAQDLEPALVVNGALYLVRTSVLEMQNTFMPATTGAVLIDDPLDNLDIDTEFDWLAAEQALAYSRKQQK